MGALKTRAGTHLQIINGSYSRYWMFHIISLNKKVSAKHFNKWDWFVINNSNVYIWKIRYMMSTNDVLQTSDQLLIWFLTCILLIVNTGYAGVRLVYSA